MEARLNDVFRLVCCCSSSLVLMIVKRRFQPHQAKEVVSLLRKSADQLEVMIADALGEK